VENPGSAPSPIFEELPRTSQPPTENGETSLASGPTQTVAPVETDTTDAAQPPETTSSPADATPDDEESEDDDESESERPEESEDSPDVVDEPRIEEPEEIRNGDSEGEVDDIDEQEDNERQDGGNDDALIGGDKGRKEPTATSAIADDPQTTTLADGIVTTIAPDPTSAAGPESDLPKTLTSETASSNSATDGGSPSTAVIAGSAVGGVAALILVLALLIWWMKRRADKRHTYVIQTPVFSPPRTGGSEKTWEFDTGSVGPTPRSAKLAEAMNNKLTAVGKIFSIKSGGEGRSEGVRMNRGNSQFIEELPMPAHSRQNSRRGGSRRSSEQIRPANPFAGVWSRNKQEAEASHGHPPRGGRAAKRTSSETPQTRRPLDFSSSKASSEDFAGALGLMLNQVATKDGGENPFSDRNEVRQGQVTRRSANPFADAHAIKDAGPYDPRTQRPRGSTTGSILQPPRLFLRPETALLEARSNVRSDQFDLEIEKPNASYSDPTAERTGDPSMTGAGRDSYTSRVTSNLSLDSMDAWGEPGPDVGPGSVSRTQQQANPLGPGAAAR
jgi:hypothetical protein